MELLPNMLHEAGPPYACDSTTQDGAFVGRPVTPTAFQQPAADGVPRCAPERALRTRCQRHTFAARVRLAVPWDCIRVEVSDVVDGAGAADFGVEHVIPLEALPNISIQHLVAGVPGFICLESDAVSVVEARRRTDFKRIH